MSGRGAASVRAGVALVLLAAGVAGAQPARDGTSRPGDPAARAGRDRLLDVPFLPQREDLCGGAAAAMVLRYWGGSSFPDDFASLVEARAEGIRTTVLVDAITARGWRTAAAAFPGRGGASTAGGAWIAAHVAHGRPVIALIDAGGGRFHYVVVVAHTADRVVLHDPAVGPFRKFPPAIFDRAWAASGRWALVVVPATHGEPPVGRPAAPAGPPVGDGPGAPLAATDARAGVARAHVASACDALVAAMVVQARAGALDAAAAGLEAATRQCPRSPDAWRELAGVRFLQARWGEAARGAAAAARLDPADAAGWDLLATSQFLDDQPVAALRSWSRIGRPRLAGIDVGGTRRTRAAIVVDRLGLGAHETITAAAFERASRRLADLPSARHTTLRYQPLDDGRASLHATVLERPVSPARPLDLAIAGAHAAIHREVRTAVASPTGGGEVWSAGWRWWHARPRVTVALETPAPHGLPGIVTVAALWERATYDVGGARVRQRRRRSAVQAADWATGVLWWRAGAALDRWDAATFASLDAGFELRRRDDRAALVADLAVWQPTGPGARFSRAALAIEARSSPSPQPSSWRASAGVTRTGAAAPLDLWEGAGLGLARAPLLRARPLLTDGVVTGEVFGRALAFATAEHERRLVARAGGRLAAAMFVDAAHAAGRARAGPVWHVDAGLGLRLHLPGGAGVLRLDAGRGLRDGRHALSAGWIQSWAARRR